AGAQYQAQINALKAMAAVVEVDEETFRTLLRSRPHPTIVAGTSGALWFKRRTYLTSYDGFFFLLRVDGPLDFSPDAAGAFYVNAKHVNIPFL
ncbi:MAG: hypothetical protein ACE5JG_09775, partial [Planctomycetota bacterium]